MSFRYSGNLLNTSNKFAIYCRSDGAIVDSCGSKITCYPEVLNALKNLDEKDYILAVASRTSQIKGARQLIRLFGWDQYFQYKEIFPGKKRKHFNNIKSQSGVGFDKMLFFDDDQRNIDNVTQLGVISILVKEGVTQQVVEDGIRRFSRERSK